MSPPSQPEKKDRRQSLTFRDRFFGRPEVVLLDDKQWLHVQKRYHMSPRELQVARLVCQGFTNGDMAEKLKVKPGTVKTHLRSIFNKTRVRNRITMLLRFIEDAGEFRPLRSDSARIHIVQAQKSASNAPVSSDLPMQE